MSSWETLRRDARVLENEIDAKLVAYAKLGYSLSQGSATNVKRGIDGNDSSLTFSTSPATSATLSGREAVASTEHVEVELESLLSQLFEILTAMNKLANSIAKTGGGMNGGSNIPATAMQHALQRHQEILADYKLDFQKTKRSIQSAREHADLLSSRNSSGASSLGPGLGGAKGDASLYEERESLASASQMADSSVGQGMSLRDELLRQRAIFAAMMERVETMSSSVPSINSLIGQVKRRKKRDVILFAVVVAGLTFATILWKVL
mmetsp:Transcript_12368/g.21137  ORF Transcript_12368/g.21137 Transcript_12368/m.21137 type:complete len:265 (-) Transcript_12368:1800-2594(-)